MDDLCSALDGLEERKVVFDGPCGPVYGVGYTGDLWSPGKNQKKGWRTRVM